MSEHRPHLIMLLQTNANSFVTIVDTSTCRLLSSTSWQSLFYPQNLIHGGEPRVTDAAWVHNMIATLDNHGNVAFFEVQTTQASSQPIPATCSVLPC